MRWLACCITLVRTLILALVLTLTHIIRPQLYVYLCLRVYVDLHLCLTCNLHAYTSLLTHILERVRNNILFHVYLHITLTYDATCTNIHTCVSASDNSSTYTYTYTVICRAAQVLHTCPHCPLVELICRLFY